MKLNFKDWIESIFGQAVDLAEPIPASNAAKALNNGAFPTYDLQPLPGRRMKRTTMKKQTKT